MGQYVHGYSGREGERLQDQANTLAALLHHDTRYGPGSSVLEAGCGIGAQTVILAANSPEARITSVDISPAQIDVARERVGQTGLSNVALLVASIYDLPFPPETFDHVFVCFVLEHLPDPRQGLECLMAMLKPGGTLTAIEGDHDSAFYAPASPYAQRLIDLLVEAQSLAGGDARIGRRLYPLLRDSGLVDLTVEPRQVYADGGRPQWVKGFTEDTFIAMVAGARETILRSGLCDEATWERGMMDLEQTAGPDGTFSYTFFKGVGTKPQGR